MQPDLSKAACGKPKTNEGNTDRKQQRWIQDFYLLSSACQPLTNKQTENYIILGSEVRVYILIDVLFFDNFC